MLKKIIMTVMTVVSLALLISQAQADENPAVKIVKIPQKGAFGRTWKLTTLVFMPPGKGPFPVMIMNHGKDPTLSGLQPDAVYTIPTVYFLSRGYAVVVPTRAGFGTSTGVFSSSHTISYLGKQAADSIQAAVEWVQKQPEFDPNQIVLIGQSYGGLGVIATGQRNLSGVKAIIDFAGGMRFDMEKGLYGADIKENIQAYKDYGVGSHAPTLLMFADNDSFWGEVAGVPTRMFDAYHQGNPNSELYDEGIANGFDGHFVVGVRQGVKQWVPEVMRFLYKHNLPSRQIYDVSMGGIKFNGTQVVINDVHVRIKPHVNRAATR